MHLKPLKSAKSSFDAYSVIDIETADWVKFLLIGHYDGKTVQQFHGNGAWVSFFEYLYRHPHTVVFAHFGGKFDFNFILKYAIKYSGKGTYGKIYLDSLIPRGSGLLSFDLYFHVRGKPARKIRFTDSSALLPFGLSSLTENFNVVHKKLKEDAGSFTRVTPELLTYNAHDLMGTFECIEAFYNWPLNQAAGRATTLAGQAMRILRTTLKGPLFDGTRALDAFARKSYFGGRTEIFKPVFESGELHYYDVTSMYPYVMRDNEFPGDYLGKSTVFDLRQMGLWEVTVTVPDQFIPPLPAMVETEGVYLDNNGRRRKRKSKKLLFPVGTFRGVWTTPELRYAIEECGVTMDVFHEGHIFENNGKMFHKFVTDLWNIRKKSKKDSVDNILSKLLLNSCYGRFGIRLEKEQIIFDEFNREGVQCDYSVSVGERNVELLKVIKPIRSFSHVGIASFVTAYARVYLHRIFRKLDFDVYYCDTDGFWTPRKLPTDKKLGGLKLECTAQSAVFLLPKTYTYRSTEGENQTRMKGFPNAGLLANYDAWNKDRSLKKVFKFGYEDFLSAMEGELRLLNVFIPPKFATIKTALKNKKFVTMTKGSPKQIRSFYDKRVVEKHGANWTTRPKSVRG